MSSDELLSRIRLSGRIPRHVAVIMDGNGRWARERMMPRTFGHRSGMSAVREVVEGAAEAGLEFLSLFAFSRENWERPPSEIDALMSLLEEYVEREARSLETNGVRVRVLGDLERLSPSARSAVQEVTRRTSSNTRLILNLFISYGARDEIARAARSLARDAVAGRLDPDSIDEETLASRLYTAGIPDPDLLIRTSGEFRLSNFLLWQLAYAELYVSPLLWPDFTRRELFTAILDFQQRERRFGRVPA
jgi:undecaprenyl diphosphate synthase